MFNKLGKKKFFVPIVPAILIFCLISLIAYPMMKMTPKDLPFAIVSLDEGQTTSQGDINLGNQIVSGVTTAVTEESPIIWDKVDSEQAVHEALDNNEYYGALVIPSDYTKQQIAAQSADADLIDGLPVIKVYIDKAKSPFVANLMQTSITQTVTELGASAELVIVHDADTGGGAMAPMMSLQLSIMPLMLILLFSSVIVYMLLRPKMNDRRTRVKSVCLQSVYAVVLSALAALTVIALISGVAGLNLPDGRMFLFLWLAGFCIMLLFCGILNLNVIFGGICAYVIIGCGMIMGMLPYELLPKFWQDTIYPWIPQRFVSDGLRSVIYMDGEHIARAVVPLLLIGLVGILVLCIVPVLPKRKVTIKLP